jgi:hypothetical protein
MVDRLWKIAKELTSSFKEKTKLLNFIEIDNIKKDHKKVKPEDADHLENYLTEEYFEYINRTDKKGIILVRKKDPNEYTVSYELKLMFSASKLCKLKLQFWTQKY